MPRRHTPTTDCPPCPCRRAEGWRAGWFAAHPRGGAPIKGPEPEDWPSGGLACEAHGLAWTCAWNAVPLAGREDVRRAEAAARGEAYADRRARLASHGAFILANGLQHEPMPAGLVESVPDEREIDILGVQPPAPAPHDALNSTADGQDDAALRAWRESAQPLESAGDILRRVHVEVRPADVRRLGLTGDRARRRLEDRIRHARPASAYWILGAPGACVGGVGKRRWPRVLVDQFLRGLRGAAGRVRAKETRDDPWLAAAQRNPPARNRRAHAVALRSGRLPAIRLGGARGPLRVHAEDVRLALLPRRTAEGGGA